MSEIIVQTDGDLFLLRTPFALKDEVKRLQGRKWDGERKLWTIPATPGGILDFHRRFGNYPLLLDEKAQRLLAQAHEAAKASIFKNADDLPDLPTKSTAWAHQRQAFHFAKAQSPGVMLAMDMGTGKSLVAIGLLEERKANLAVIVGPRRALPVWPREFAAHAERDWHVIVPPLQASTQARANHIIAELGNAAILKKPAAVCINYEAYWRDALAAVLKRLPIDVLILDESHRVKAPGGKASKFAQTLGKRAKLRVALTGTPMPHSPLDVYAQYRALDPSIFGTSFSRFRATYAIMGGFESRQVVGWQNEEELARKFGSISFVCKSDDVLDLPEYHHVALYCDLEPQARRMYRQLDEEFVTQLDEDDWVVTDNALVKLLRLQQLTAGWLKDEDGDLHRVSHAKEILLKDTLVDFKRDEPLICIGRFHTDLDIFRAAAGDVTGDELGKPTARRYAELSGRVKEHHADYALKGANMREDVDLVGLQLQAGGVGIDLTRAAYNIFYSMGYNLGDYLQVLKRSHRPGQVRPVTYFHLIARDTKDEAVYEALTNRQNVVEAVVAASRR